MSEAIQNVIDTLSELKRMHQLNFELLEQLNVTCQWIIDYKINIPNETLMRSLVGKSLALLNELRGDTPKTLTYKKIANESLHEPKNNEDFTEPFIMIFLSLNSGQTNVYDHWIRLWL